MELYGKLNDAELAILLKASDEAAFTTLYYRYWEQIYYIALKKLGDEQQAGEAVQDIFISLWKQRESFQLKTTFEQYFGGAVKYQIIRRRAQREKQQARETAYDNDLHAHLLESQADDPGQEENHALLEQLIQAINTLPPKCQLVFKMSRSEEYTNKKIAAELGISEKAVEKHITTAMKILRANLGHNLLLALILHHIQSAPSPQKRPNEKKTEIIQRVR